jgi:hypothetical protein
MPPLFPEETSDTIPFSHRSTMFPLPESLLRLSGLQIRQSVEYRVHRLVEAPKKSESGLLKIRLIRKTVSVPFLRRARLLTTSRLTLDRLDCSAPWPSPQGGLAPLALQPRAPGAGGQRPHRRAALRCACHAGCQARVAASAGQDWRAHYSATLSPDPPSSAGKSLSFGRPSRIGSTVSE